MLLTETEGKYLQLNRRLKLTINSKCHLYIVTVCSLLWPPYPLKICVLNIYLQQDILGISLRL